MEYHQKFTSIRTHQTLHVILDWEVLPGFSSRQICGQVKSCNVLISTLFLINSIYDQVKIWNVKMILGNASLEVGEEKTGFLAIQCVVLHSFYFIRF